MSSLYIMLVDPVLIRSGLSYSASSIHNATRGVPGDPDTVPETYPQMGEKTGDPYPLPCPYGLL